MKIMKIWNYENKRAAFFLQGKNEHCSSIAGKLDKLRAYYNLFMEALFLCK